MADAQTTVEYRDLPGKPGYRVGSDGSVWRQLPQHVDAVGYKSISIKRRKCRVHVLVLTAFAGPRPAGLVCCHNDGDKLNNVVGNLRWDTARANVLDRDMHGTSNRGERNGHARLTAAIVRQVRMTYACGGWSYARLGRLHGVSRYTIRGIVRGRSWSHVSDTMP